MSDFSGSTGGGAFPPVGTTQAGATVMIEPTPAPRGFINALLVRRKDERGDLVGTLALWSFLSLIFCLVLGGSSLTLGGLHLVVPSISLETLVGLLSPIVGHVIKSTMEGRQG